jgi:cell division protein FtsW (lipid II flippase)
MLNIILFYFWVILLTKDRNWAKNWIKIWTKNLAIENLKTHLILALSGYIYIYVAIEKDGGPNYSVGVNLLPFLSSNVGTPLVQRMLEFLSITASRVSIPK